ncbi:MAG: 30S ribosomal protein S8 [Alphaproteobacteria bacterium]|nr:30S ribosomal protein S8 [Alphaproteobacteria bacterium]
MATNDRIADMITRIRNASSARLPVVKCPHANVLADICAVLEREGYIRGFKVLEENNKRDLEIEVKYHEGEPVIREIKRISKSGQRKYSPIKALPKQNNGLGISILSTSKGVMSDFEARQAHVGGEVLCSVF